MTSPRNSPAERLVVTDPLRIARDAHTRQALLRAAGEADRALADEAARRPELAGAVAEWRARIESLCRKSGAGEARVAFVGAVKSGKSTLVNALVGLDVLPRGSGILTSQVTALRSGPAPAVRVLWKGRPEVNQEFRSLLAGLGLSGPWDLGNLDHRATAERALTATRIRPQHAALRALLVGAPSAWDGLGAEQREESVPGTSDLARWAARDEVAAFVTGLDVQVPAPDIPPGLVLLDCQGADAWNAAHTRGLDEALLGAHALVYVISSRVGLREADFQFFERLRALGLLDLTRVVLNVDLGELRNPTDLARVVASVERGLEQAGLAGGATCLSALQGLLERRLLLAPEAVRAGERRLVDAWDAEGSAAATECREAFHAFREDLFASALGERDRMVLTRARADLRQVLVEATRRLRAGQAAAARLQRTGWEADTADALLAWVQNWMTEKAAAEKAAISAAIAERFRARRAPQRALWLERVRTLDPDSAGTWAEAGGDPVAAAAMLGARLEEGAAQVLAATEPLRVNAIRNLALEARGHLARAGEEAGLEAAGVLEKAGLRPGAPPVRRALSREITATRRVPLFRNRTSLGPEGTGDRHGEGGLLRRAARSVGARLAPRLRRVSGLGRAEAEGCRTLLVSRLSSVWDEYVAEVEQTCLAPHVDDAAAQVYARVASWVLAQVADAGDVAAALSCLDEAEPPPGANSAPSSQTSTASPEENP